MLNDDDDFVVSEQMHQNILIIIQSVSNGYKADSI